MSPDMAANIAGRLTNRDHMDALDGQRVTVVTGISTNSRSPRHSFTGGELDLLIQLAAACWAQQVNGVPGQPTVNPSHARLAMRAYHAVNGLAAPTRDQLRAARGSDFY